jgi:carnitine O-acetyltransferase
MKLHDRNGADINEDKAPMKTYQFQDKLPHLPIPKLEDTCARYIRALEGLQDAKEHAKTKLAVEEFLKGDGPSMQEKLKTYAADKARYVSAYLSTPWEFLC